MTKVVWSPEAQADLASIDDQLFLENPDFADRVAIASVQSARFLLDWPFAGPMVGEQDYRKWRVKRTPYIFIYRPADGDVHILRVYHERQDWGIAP